MAASPSDSSQQTTQARTIETMDGYVSRGRDPPSSVPRDHAMLQDFAAYLELRLKSQNLSILRRIFADFLNEQENTLVPMMKQGCTIVTIFPVLRTSAPRLRKAKYLLAKPKFFLDPRGCVFLYLQYRAATRNMALLKHMLLEFLCHKETGLLEFVERGNQVISVIPFELPRVVPTTCVRPAPTANPAQQQEPPRTVETPAEQQQEPPGTVEAPAEQQQVESEVAKVRKTRIKNRKERPAVTATQSTPNEAPTASPASSEPQQTVVSADAGTAVVSRRRRGRPKKVKPRDDNAGAAQQRDEELVANRHTSAAAAPSTSNVEGSQDSSPLASSTTAQSTPARDRAPKTTAPLQQNAATTPGEVQRRKRSAEADTLSDTVRTREKTHKRGKPAMTEAMCRSQVELKRKMDAFEAQIPWEAVYANLSPPFDDEKYPELAVKFHLFWHRHARAVWERDFWAPMSRKMNAAAFNKRNNRQIAAKNAFEVVIVAAYKQLGAAFFVKLDTQKPRHPGWWYRSPVVALFALQETQGEDAVWDYVQSEALERFPNCGLLSPLSAGKSCRKGESDSMWITNHPLAPAILREIAVLKTEQRAREPRDEQEETHGRM